MYCACIVLSSTNLLPEIENLGAKLHLFSISIPLSFDIWIIFYSFHKLEPSFICVGQSAKGGRDLDEIFGADEILPRIRVLSQRPGAAQFLFPNGIIVPGAAHLPSFSHLCPEISQSCPNFCPDEISSKPATFFSLVCRYLPFSQIQTTTMTCILSGIFHIKEKRTCCVYFSALFIFSSEFSTLFTNFL